MLWLLQTKGLWEEADDQLLSTKLEKVLRDIQAILQELMHEEEKAEQKRTTVQLSRESLPNIDTEDAQNKVRPVPLLPTSESVGSYIVGA